jgi:anti-sigma factor RsiW
MMPKADCDAARMAIAPFLDGELDAGERAAVESHLEGCADCRAALADARAMSALFRAEVPRERAPADLGARIEARIAAEEGAQADRARWYRGAPALAAAAVMLFLLGGVLARWALPPAQENLAARDAIAAHVRALVSERLTDVASSDRHTVKPWFDGRIELAPPVEDLTPEGFRLVGGRVDYVDGRRVAALVYRHRQHVLTLFVGPGGALAGGPASAQGYAIVQWSQGGMSFRAVSDLDRGELERFAALLRARLPSP